MKQLQKRLVIDTATHARYVGLFEGDRSIEEVYEPGHNHHSETLIPTIEALCKQCAFALADVDQIIVGIGPGSYTGVRIGVTVAKMFGWTLSIPVYAISSLALMASAHIVNDVVVPTIDARRGNTFLGVYTLANNQLVALEDDQYTALEAFRQSHQAYRYVSEGKPNPPLIFQSPLLKAVDNIHELAPHYLRKTEAERNLEAKP